MIDPALESQIANLAQSMGFVLYDIVWVKENEQNILRVSLTKPHDNPKHTIKPRPAISLDECALFSTALSPLLDVALEQSQAYHLEVSSPGLERTLKKPQHFALSIGEEVGVTLKDKSTDSKNVIIEGLLCACDEESITLEGHTPIPLAQIKKVKTIFRF
ncbi:ribosome maturation factor RimP [uncultured Helicobacter sp.]|uniref:ribosome maturation factor RimP n=1 Tax=uncultured Helicobacter sp. TaxID=175537 RepID=UPI00374E92D2